MSKRSQKAVASYTKKKQDDILSPFANMSLLKIRLLKSADPSQVAKHLPSLHVLHDHVKIRIVLRGEISTLKVIWAFSLDPL